MIAPAGFLVAAPPGERQKQKKTVLLANAAISNSIFQAVRHVFGAHGSEAFRSTGTPAMEMEVQTAIERAVESAYYAGVRHGVDLGAKGQETLAQLGPLGPNGPGVHPLAPSDKNLP